MAEESRPPAAPAANGSAGAALAAAAGSGDDGGCASLGQQQSASVSSGPPTPAPAPAPANAPGPSDFASTTAAATSVTETAARAEADAAVALAAAEQAEAARVAAVEAASRAKAKAERAAAKADEAAATQQRVERKKKKQKKAVLEKIVAFTNAGRAAKGDGGGNAEIKIAWKSWRHAKNLIVQQRRRVAEAEGREAKLRAKADQEGRKRRYEERRHAREQRGASKAVAQANSREPRPGRSNRNNHRPGDGEDAEGADPRGAPGRRKRTAKRQQQQLQLQQQQHSRGRNARGQQAGGGKGRPRACSRGSRSGRRGGRGGGRGGGGSVFVKQEGDPDDIFFKEPRSAVQVTPRRGRFSVSETARRPIKVSPYRALNSIVRAQARHYRTGLSPQSPQRHLHLHQRPASSPTQGRIRLPPKEVRDLLRDTRDALRTPDGSDCNDDARSGGRGAAARRKVSPRVASAHSRTTAGDGSDANGDGDGDGDDGGDEGGNGGEGRTTVPPLHLRDSGGDDDDDDGAGDGGGSRDGARGTGSAGGEADVGRATNSSRPTSGTGRGGSAAPPGGPAEGDTGDKEARGEEEERQHHRQQLQQPRDSQQVDGEASEHQLEVQDAVGASAPPASPPPLSSASPSRGAGTPHRRKQQAQKKKKNQKKNKNLRQQPQQQSEEDDADSAEQRAVALYANACATLDKSTQLLQTLHRTELFALTSRKEPPRVVLLVMGAVCSLLGLAPTFHEARRALLDRRFVRRLSDVKHYSLGDRARGRLARFLDHPEFTLLTVSKVNNRALLALAQHTFAMRDAATLMAQQQLLQQQQQQQRRQNDKEATAATQQQPEEDDAF